MAQEQQKVLGVDVSKDKLDMYLNPTGEAWTVKNDRQSIRRYILPLTKNP